MTVTAYSLASGPPVTLTTGGSNAVVALRLPHTGMFVVWGKVIVSNSATTAQAGSALMTTLDGATTTDVAEFYLGVSGLVTLSLQSTLNLGLANTNEVVDIRCFGASGTATYASLIAIPVDALSGPVGPGS